MFELYLQVSTRLSLILAVITIPILMPLLLLQYYIHKKLLDPTCFNINHFSEGELAFFTSAVIFYISKTLVYVRVIALPSTMRKHFKDHPKMCLLA